MEFLNTPLMELFGYKIYPLFFVPIILIPIIIIISIVIKNSRKNKLPEEVKSTNKIRMKNDEVEKTLDDGNPEGEYNIISEWQKENLTDLLDREIDKYKSESIGALADDDQYISIINALKSYINNHEYWSVAELVSIVPNAALFLTMLVAGELEKEVHGANVDRTVLFANTIDRINGGFETGSNLNREWMSSVSEPIASNYEGPEDGKRLLGCIINSMEFLVGFMDDGVIPNDVLYADNELQMVSEGDINVAANELMEAKNFIMEASRRTQAIVLYTLVFRLRHQIDNIISSGQTQTIRPVDFNIVRGIAIMADRQDYGEIVDEFLD